MSSPPDPISFEPVVHRDLRRGQGMPHPSLRERSGRNSTPIENTWQYDQHLHHAQSEGDIFDVAVSKSNRRVFAFA
jgi:hypothetical protein